MIKHIEKKAVHPGEVLRERFMSQFGLTINRVAHDLGVPVTRIAEIVNECRSITPEMALRLARYLGTTPEFWLNLQMEYILQRTRAEMGDMLSSVQPLRVA